MPIATEVIEDGQIVHVTFVHPWKAEDMNAAFEQDRLHREWFQRDHPGRKVHLLATFVNARTFPPGILRASLSPGLGHPTGGQVAVVGTATIVRSIGETVFKLARFKHAKFFDTDERALTYLRQVIAAERTPA